MLNMLDPKAKQRKKNKLTIYLLLAVIYLGFVIYITVWDKTKGAALTWYYISSVFILIICLIRLALVLGEDRIVQMMQLQVVRQQQNKR